MTTTTSPLSGVGVAERDTPTSTAPQGPSFWQRFENFWRALAMADRESAVERFVRENGGTMTDNLEREISRRFGRPAGEA